MGMGNPHPRTLLLLVGLRGDFITMVRPKSSSSLTTPVNILVRHKILLWFAVLSLLGGTTFDYVVFFQALSIGNFSLNLSTAEIGILIFLFSALAYGGKDLLPCLKRHGLPLSLILGIWLSSFISAIMAGQMAAPLKLSLRYLVMYLALVGFLLLVMHGQTKPLKRMVGVWGILMGVGGIIEYLFPPVEGFLLTTFLPMMGSDVRVGTVFNPNVYGAFMGLVFFLGLMRLVSEASWLSLSATAFGLIGLTLAGSRNAWLTTGICLSIYGLTRKNWRWLLKAGVPILLVWIGLVFWSGGSVLWRVKNPIFLGERTVVWSAVLAAWKTSPLVGIGPRAFSLRLHEFVPPERRAEYEAQAGQFNAHNIFLNALAEQGLVGAILLGVFAGWLMYKLMRQIGHDDEVLLLTTLTLPLLLDDFTYSYFYLTLLALFLALALEQRASTVQGSHGVKADLGSPGRGTE